MEGRMKEVLELDTAWQRKEAFGVLIRRPPSNERVVQHEDANEGQKGMVTDQGQ